MKQKTVHGEKVLHRAWSLKLRFDRSLSQLRCGCAAFYYESPGLSLLLRPSKSDKELLTVKSTVILAPLGDVRLFVESGQ